MKRSAIGLHGAAPTGRNSLALETMPSFLGNPGRDLEKDICYGCSEIRTQGRRSHEKGNVVVRSSATAGRAGSGPDKNFAAVRHRAHISHLLALR